MASPTPVEATSTLEQGQAELDALLARLSEPELTRAATIGGGEWSAKDLLGHIAYWEELAVGFAGDWRAGRRPEVTDIQAKGPAGVDAANAQNQEITRSQSLEDVRERATAAHARVVRIIREWSSEEWSARPFYPTPRANETFSELLGGILGGASPFGHAHEHLPDLRAYVESLETGKAR